jgi:uncharacterized protein (TIRG00374 family)
VIRGRRGGATLLATRRRKEQAMAVGRRVAALALTALVLYGAAPAILDVLDAWPQAQDILARWWAAMLLCETGSLWCLWKLQAICMGVHRMTPVATSQLASGALGRVVPGGAAAAAAGQYAMLAKAGVSRDAIAVGLTAGTVLQLAALAALPLAALPAIVLGLRIPEGLLPGLIGGAALFAAMFGFALLVVRRDAVLHAVARAARSILRRLGREEVEALPERVLALRDELVARLGRRWLVALAAAVGRWALDFLALAAALAAVSDDTRLSLVLLAYVGAQLLAQVPITPGGLGVVEAGLSGLLIAAGVSASAAAVATLAYRLVSYWLMLPAGLAGWVVERVRTS